MAYAQPNRAISGWWLLFGGNLENFIGVLYYDPRSLDAGIKILELAELYKKKMGIMPNVCLVNPVHIVSVDGILIIPDKSMFSQYYFWLGHVEDKDE